MSQGAYRPEFEAALRLFARASEAMHRRGFQRPILVGGAAAEFYSQSAITTGDFDLCTFRQPELEEELQRLGFVRPSGPGQMLKGWVHPELKLHGIPGTAYLFRSYQVPLRGFGHADRARSARPPHRRAQGGVWHP